MILLHFHIGIAAARPTKPSHRVLYKSHEPNIGWGLITPDTPYINSRPIRKLGTGHIGGTLVVGY